MLNHVICLCYPCYPCLCYPFVIRISSSKLPKHLTLATWLLMSYGGYPFYTTNPSYKQLSCTLTYFETLRFTSQLRETAGWQPAFSTIGRQPAFPRSSHRICTVWR